jgi:hypothetical protein
MPFVIGLVIGLGAGFAGAVLFAPERAEAVPGKPPVVGANGKGGFKSVFGDLRKNLDEALGEAKKAQREAEEEMIQRYRRIAGRSGK